MEIALALIYVLLHIVPPSTPSFTLRTSPDTAFHLTRAEQGEWVARLKTKSGEKPYGTLKVEGRTLQVTTPQGTEKFPAADRLRLPQSPDWARIEKIGPREAQWAIERFPERIDFTAYLYGKEHPGKAVATLDSFKAAK